MTASEIKEKGQMEVKTIAVAVLGAHVEDGGLGEDDGDRYDDEIVECHGALEYLYDEHYNDGRNWDEVRIELVERAHLDRVTAELAALQSQLNETDAENDRLRVRALPENWEELLVAEMERRFDLSKREDDHMCFDDTQIGVEFAADFIRALENKHEQQ